MKRFLLVLLAACLVAALSATAALAAVEVEGSAYVGFYDKYVWRGIDLSGSEGVVQGGVEVSHKGFSLEYWTNIQASDDKEEDELLGSGEATETDITLSYTLELGETASLSVGNIYYTLDDLDDTNEVFVSASLHTLLEPTLTAYYDWDECENDGMFFTAEVSHSFELADGLSLGLGALISYNQKSDYAIDDYSDWHNYELSAGIDYSVTENVTISPSFLYSAPISPGAKDRIDTETVGGVQVSFSF